jgi:hypothetical protein
MQQESNGSDKFGAPKSSRSHCASRHCAAARVCIPKKADAPASKKKGKGRRSRHGATCPAERAAAMSECVEAIKTQKTKGLLESVAARFYVLETTVKRWIRHYVEDKKKYTELNEYEKQLLRL